MNRSGGILAHLRRILVLWLVLASAAASGSIGVASSPAAEATRAAAAAGQVLGKLADVQALQRRCGPADGSSAFHLFKAVVFAWAAANDDFLYASARILEGAKSDLDSSERPDSCDEMANRIVQGREDISVVMPEAAATLRGYLDRHPMPEAVHSERNTEIGCLKAALNRGDSVVQYAAPCKCLAAEFMQATSADDRKAYWKDAASKVPGTMDKWVDLMMGVTMRCASTLRPLYREALEKN